MAVGRVNADSFIDCLVAQTGTPSGARILSGDGVGDFSGQSMVFGSSGLTYLVGAELNGDGYVDAVGCAAFSIRVFLSNGTGGYLVPLSLPSCPTPTSASMGDVDGDGDLDIVATCSTSEIQLILNQGSGVYGPSVFYARGITPDHAIVLDYDQDGVPDLAVRGSTGTDFLRGLGGLQFTLGLQIAAYFLLDVSDLNMDGRGDLIGVEGPYSGQLSLRRNLGGGAFAEPDLLSPVVGPIWAARAFRLSGDARPKLLVLSGTGQGYLDVFNDTAPDCNGNGIDDPVEIAQGMISDCNVNGIPDTCEVDCNLNGTADACEIMQSPTLDLNHNGSLDTCEPVGIAFCFGDSTGAACPCDPGQSGPPGTGCRNSTGGGGKLRAFGNAQVALDSVTIEANGLDAHAVGVLFQGTAQQAGGLGTPFGDGLLCVNGAVTRLTVRTASSGVLRFGRDAPGDPLLSVAGALPVTGATLFYQSWYRDSGAFCTPLTYNMTNALSISWTP